MTHRLVINSAKVTDAGKYKCMFEQTSTWCNLTVIGLWKSNKYQILTKKLKICLFEGSEEFVRKLDDVEVTEKEEATLVVELSSENAMVTWHKVYIVSYTKRSLWTGLLCI